MMNRMARLAWRILPAVVLLLALAAGTSVGFAQGPKPAPIPKPPPPIGAKSLADTPQWDKIAAGAAKTLGFANYVYDAWQLPPTTTWDDTFEYYSDQMVKLRWSGDPVEQVDITGGKVAAWMNADGKTGLVIVFIASTDGKAPAYDFAIFGLTTPVPTGDSGWTAIAKTADWDQMAAQLSQTVGFGNYVYDIWQAPASTTWDGLSKFFSDQLSKAGWKGQSAMKEISGIKVGIWLDSSNTGLVLLLSPSADGKSAIVAAIYGLPTAAPAGATPIAKTTTTDSQAAGYAKTLGLTDYDYEIWQVPVSTTWDNVVAYYTDQVKQTGVAFDKPQTADVQGVKVIGWQSTDKKYGIATIYIPNADKTKPATVIALGGSLTP
jgi:hypothetical protein